MKINPSVAFEHYQNLVSGVKTAEVSPKNQAADLVDFTAEPVNTDKVHISDAAVMKAEAAKQAKLYAPSLEAGTTSKIETLRTAVQNGTYYVGTGDLANAIMSRVFGEFEEK